MMYSIMVNFTVRLVVLMVILVSNLVASSSSRTSPSQNALTKHSSANSDKMNSIVDSSYELIKLNSTLTNSTDGRKSADLNLLTRLYQRLHDIHNRHHHHHMHHLGRGSSFHSTLFGDRPFNRLFRDRPMERPMNYDRQMNRPVFDRPDFDRPYNRPYSRPWSRRRKRHVDSNRFDDYSNNFNLRKTTPSQLTSSDLSSFDPQSTNSFNRSPFHKSSSNYSSLYDSSNFHYNNSSPPNSFTLTTFRPFSNTFSHSYDRQAHRRPYHSLSSLKSPIKSHMPSTTPNSISLTTASSFYLIDGDINDSLFDQLSPYNSSHHYYHQAYLLYKYYKMYRDKNVNEIDWSSLLDEVRDKFRMLVHTLRYINPRKGANKSGNAPSDELVISKALEIVKWKGWELKEQKRKETNKKLDDFRPITVNEPGSIVSSIKDPTAKEWTERTSTVKSHKQSKVKPEANQTTEVAVKQASPFERQWTTNEINSIDQVDEIESSTYPSYSYNTNLSVYTSSNTYSSVDTSLTTIRPLTSTMSSNDELKRAFENIEDIRMNHSCSRPKGRLVNLKELNHDFRFLLPKCVYLHKCDNQSGCCLNQRQYCAPIEQEVVVKYFYNLSSNKKQSRVVRLEFVNDTRCQCRDTEKVQSTDLNKDNKLNPFRPMNLIKSIDKSPFNDNMVKEDLSNNRVDVVRHREQDIRSVYGNQFIEPYRSPSRYPSQQYRHQVEYNLVRSDASNNVIQTDENSEKKSVRTNNFWNKKFNGKLNVLHLFDCNSEIVCPEPYTCIPDRNQQNLCYCGCKSKNVNCIRVMNGLRKLDNYQMSCVLNGQCQYPECLFKTGDLDYNINTGYCPTKEDAY